ncbi:MAG: thioredoxin domain-containing protein [Planctomycetes bacterium]|nr:thioredoxin domain-containing protein [Planctomycetota bacterium]
MEEAQDRIEWREFGAEAFAEAERTDRPILLSIVASWCRWCRELDRSTLADPAVVAEIRRHFVPVRADKDRRPDVDARYNAGGWPTLAVLTPDGTAITRTTYLSAKALLHLCSEALPLYRAKRGEIEGVVAKLAEKAREDMEKTVSERLRPQIARDVRAAIEEAFDEEHGGFGTGQKFPHTEAIDFAMILAVRERDERMGDVVRVTLDRMAASPIRDRIGGGFFRYAARRDWSAPHPEKVLDSNAARLHCYLEAWQVYGNPTYRAVAEETLAFLLETLRDPATGAFAAAHYGEPAWFASSRDDRRRQPQGAKIDRTIYANWNAQTASALYKASRVLDRPDLVDVAVQTLGFVQEEMYAPGVGIYHYFDETYHLPGLLSDQAYVLRAIVDHTHTTGDNAKLAWAAEIVELLRARAASKSGGFYDTHEGVPSPGGLKHRNRSILENAVLAEALTRLGYLMRDGGYLDLARRTLETFVDDYRTYGYFVAGYARAVDLLFHPPLCVTVVGRRGDAATQALRQAALASYVPSLVVQQFDPERDEKLLARSGCEARAQAVAYVEIPRTSQAAVEDPAELPAAMREIDAGRG